MAYAPWAGGLSYSVQDANGTWHEIKTINGQAAQVAFGFNTDDDPQSLIAQTDFTSTQTQTTVAKEINKLYASVNGQTKLVFQSQSST